MPFMLFSRKIVDVRVQHPPGPRGDIVIRIYQFHGGIVGNEIADALAMLGSLPGGDLLVCPVPLSAICTASSMDGSERKSRGIEGTDQVFLFLGIYDLLWTVREQVSCWAWKRLKPKVGCRIYNLALRD